MLPHRSKSNWIASVSYSILYLIRFITVRGQIAWVAYLVTRETVTGGSLRLEGGGLTAGQFPVAGNVAFFDNSPTMSTTEKPRSLAGRLELWLISVGMSVFAYLLEKVILRSVKSGGEKQ
jgi:hypothetical protein